MSNKMLAPTLGFMALLAFLVVFFGVLCGVGYLDAFISGVPAPDIETVIRLGSEGLFLVFQICMFVISVGLAGLFVWFFSREVGKALLASYEKRYVRKNQMSA